jgi:TetR/AcrR family transcriptional regulator, transcriptional repressor for nem operon
MTSTETKSRILEVAARLFHEQGFNATGVSTILREAGINSGSLYYFFASKEALLHGVLEQYVQMLHPIVIAPVEAKTSDPIERVFALLDQYRQWLEPTGFAMGCPIGNLALEVADGLPDVRILIHRNFDNWVAAVRGWLESAGDRLRPSTDLDQLARFILTVMEGGVMQARAEGSARPYDACVSQLRTYLGLLEREAACPGPAGMSINEPRVKRAPRIPSRSSPRKRRRSS